MCGYLRGGGYSGIHVFLVCLHVAIKKVDANLIQKLCYMEGVIPWRECSILWTTYPPNLFAVHVL